ncbi:MAG: AMP-binding protein, partial [Kibdelosporangium sp.]
MGLLTQVVAEQIAKHGDAVAVGGSRGHLTYSGLGELSAQLAVRLTELLAGDTRVGIYAGNSPDYIALYLAVLKTGAVPFLMDPAMGAVELAAIASSCGLQAVVRDRHLPEGVRSTQTDQVGPFHLDRLVPGDAPDLLPTTEVCRFTSGSTGMPNCIEFSGTTVLNAARGWVQATSLEAGERILCFAGLFNGLAFNTSLLPAFLAGASLWLPSGLPTSGQVARFVDETGPTRLTGFPALYESLLRRETAIPGLADLRVSLSSAAPLKLETLAALREKHSLVVSNYYGVAETGPLTFDPAPPLDNGLGYPLPGVEFAWRDADTQVLSVRSPSMGSRYLNVPGGFEARLDEAGFYRTGDEGESRDGRIFLHGRWASAIN